MADPLVHITNGIPDSGTGNITTLGAVVAVLTGVTTGVGAGAAEYLDSAGGPVLASGVASGLRLLPSQNLTGKGRSVATITATTVGNTGLVFASAAITNTIPAGAPIYLFGAATVECVFATQAWVPGSSATVPLQSPVVNAGQTGAGWDVFSVNGPQISGFQPFGIGVEGRAIYDPVTTLYYIERSATQDGMVPYNIVAGHPMLFNGASFDRWRGDTTSGAWVNVKNANANVQGGAPVTVGAVVPTAIANGSTSSRVNAAASTNATSLKASAGQIYNIDVFNTAAYTVFLKIYNKASAPTVGTDTPVWTIPIPAGGGFSKFFPMGKTLGTGIAYAITKLQADSDTTVVVAGDLTGAIDWV